MKYLLYRKEDKEQRAMSPSTPTKPIKNKSDISIGDVINNGKAKKETIRKMINPKKYV